MSAIIVITKELLPLLQRTKTNCLTNEVQFFGYSSGISSVKRDMTSPCIQSEHRPKDSPG